MFVCLFVSLYCTVSTGATQKEVSVVQAKKISLLLIQYWTYHTHTHTQDICVIKKKMVSPLFASFILECQIINSVPFWKKASVGLEAGCLPHKTLRKRICWCCSVFGYMLPSAIRKFSSLIIASKILHYYYYYMQQLTHLLQFGCPQERQAKGQRKNISWKSVQPSLVIRP